MRVAGSLNTLSAKMGYTQFWQQKSKPIVLESPKWTHQKLTNIHLNPVRNEIVQEPEEYEYSSACTYLKKSGYLVIEDQT
jgi:hypothetical protein